MRSCKLLTTEKKLFESVVASACIWLKASVRDRSALFGDSVAEEDEVEGCESFSSRCLSARQFLEAS